MSTYASVLAGSSQALFSTNSNFIRTYILLLKKDGNENIWLTVKLEEIFLFVLHLFMIKINYFVKSYI